MDEVHGFCVRMLGPGDAARAAEQAARATPRGDRLTLLTAAVAECRDRRRAESRAAPESQAPPGGASDPEPGDEPRSLETEAGDTKAAEAEAGGGPTLAEAVADELARTTARLSELQREALALSELLGLPHEEIGRIVGVERADVAPLLASARLRLRTELRGESPAVPECPERDRALRTIALRQDDEDVLGADDDWLVEHLGHCQGCGRAHAAMLEASACYRAWRLPADEPLVAGA